MRKLICVSLIIFLLPILSIAQSSRQSKIDFFDWQEKKPLDFIEVLKQKGNVPWVFAVNKGYPPCKEKNITK